MNINKAKRPTETELTSFISTPIATSTTSIANNRKSHFYIYNVRKTHDKAVKNCLSLIIESLKSLKLLKIKIFNFKI
jgi:hypothetical protein